MPSLYVLLFLTTWAGLYPLLPVASAAEPSARELVRLAPTVKSGGGKYRNIKVSGYVKQSGFIHLEFRVLYRAPDRYALRIADGTDGTPIVYLVNDQLYMYNAVDGILLYLSKARFEFALGPAEDHFSYRFEVTKSEQPCNILVDLRTLYDGEAQRDDIVRVDGGTFRLIRTFEGGHSLVALIEPSRRCPFKQIAFNVNGINEPQLFLREIAVDEDVDEAWPIFPPKDRFAGRVNMVDWSKDAFLENLSILSFMNRSCHARPAIRNKDLREPYEDRFGIQVDWDKVEVNDRRISRTIRGMLGSLTDTKSGE